MGFAGVLLLLGVFLFAARESGREDSDIGDFLNSNVGLSIGIFIVLVVIVVAASQ